MNPKPVSLIPSHLSQFYHKRSLLSLLTIDVEKPLHYSVYLYKTEKSKEIYDMTMDKFETNTRSQTGWVYS